MTEYEIERLKIEKEKTKHIKSIAVSIKDIVTNIEDIRNTIGGNVSSYDLGTKGSTVIDLLQEIANVIYDTNGSALMGDALRNLATLSVPDTMGIEIKLEEINKTLQPENNSNLENQIENY